jgi:hypothetical protein
MGFAQVIYPANNDCQLVLRIVQLQHASLLEQAKALALPARIEAWLTQLATALIQRDW